MSASVAGGEVGTAAEFQNMPVGQAFKNEEAKYVPGAQWNNWVSLEGGCKPGFHHRPSSVEEVVAIVKQAARDKKPVKVAGYGHSPNSMAFVQDDGHMIHLKDSMRRILAVDSTKRTVTVEGGCTLRKLCEVLDGQELMLPVLTSVSDITVAGACSICAHSSGINKPTLSSAIQAMTIVTGKGEVLRLDEVTGENAELFPALRCSLGVMGVICQLTLRVERKAIFKMHSNPVDIATVHKNLASKVMMTESYRFWWIPHTEMCYETSVSRLQHQEEGRQSVVGSVAGSVASTAMVEPNAKLPRKPNLQQQARKNISNALQMVRPLKSEERTYLEWVAQEQSFPRRLVKSLDCPRAKDFLVESALYAGCKVPQLQPTVNRVYRKLFLDSESITYGTLMDAFSIPIVLPQRANEWAIEANRCLEVLDGLRDLIKRQGLRVHFIVEVRFGDEEDIWMSPCYKRKTCYIGIVQFRPFNAIDSPDTDKYYREFASFITRAGGRPHWSKYFGPKWDYGQFYKAYPKWRDFLAVQKKLDPQGLFINPWFKNFLPAHSKL